MHLRVSYKATLQKRSKLSLLKLPITTNLKKIKKHIILNIKCCRRIVFVGLALKGLKSSWKM